VESDESLAQPLPAPSLQDAFWIWAQIGLLSFGGPAAQIALMHRMIVEERKWLSESDYTNALSFCMLLPGPEAMQLATYAGWKMHGTIGGLIAGLLFVIPGACVVLVLATIYALFGQLPLLTALIAIAAFVSLFFLNLPYPLIIVVAALAGYMFSAQSQQQSSAGAASTHKFSHTCMTIAIWLAIWWLPLFILAATNQFPLLTEIGYFFSRLAVVTFGGAYAVLAYLAQDVVTNFGWLEASEMLDGLGLAETTPGPLILVTEFVGFLAGFKEGGIALAVAAAIVTLWVTFTPCFLWIFAGAPYINWISERAALRGALAAITAAVVGVIFNLSLWFALHVFFTTVESKHWSILTLWIPDLATLDFKVVLLTALSAILIFRLKWSVLKTLLVASISGWALVTLL